MCAIDFSLTLTESLRSGWCVHCSAGHFLSRATKSTKKRPWKPMVSTQLRAVRRMHSTSQKRIAYGSHFWGVMDSFPRRTTQFVMSCTARKNWFVETSPKCSMAAATIPLSRSPLQNVEDGTPIFLSGAAAKREAGTIPDLHQNAVLKVKSRGCFAARSNRPKEVKGPLVPCGVSLVTFFRW